MRSCVISAFTLAVALAPAASFAQATGTSGQPSVVQQPPAGQPPAGQPPAGQPPPTTGQPPAAQTPPAPTAPKVTFSSPVGVLLVPIKPDKTAVFEEMVTKLKSGFAKTQDPTIQKQAAGFKVYKSSEPLGPNALYVIIADPAVGSSEYDLFHMLSKTMTPDELRAPETADMWKRFLDAFAPNMSKLNLTLLGG
jgi:hypothetical protein